MISVERKDGFALKISRILREATEHRLDIYLFIPGELGLNTNVVPEEEFYHGAIHVQRTYFSDQPLLPLVHSRLARRGKLTTEQYRLSLSLYAYQYVVGLEQSSHKLRNEKDGASQEAIEEVIALAQDILRRLRRNVPTDQTLLKYYVNIDNYLSWFTEQRLLSLVAHLPRSGDYKTTKSLLLEICDIERQHRDKQQYNSSHTTEALSRISNKMRLLRRLIEYPVTLKEKTRELGGGEQKLLKAGVTAVVMTSVSLAAYEVRETLGGISLMVIFALALLYALRELFKDDLRNTLWRWLRKGRPKWRRQYFDVHSTQLVGRQLEWFDYRRPSRLSEEILAARHANVSQREEVVMHYGSHSRMLPTRFLSGYEQTRELLHLDLSLLSKLMEKGSHHVYQLKEGQVSRQPVEKRYLINLVTREIQGQKPPVIQRWKVVMSRSKIVEIEEIPQRKPAGSPPET
ncbi:hypothetical protein [Oceanisphaera arctica]|uniref:Uncharacterized protein n=1 Tax=Oceanisphaera arctica TaxID=641510 RepID=A0A2P5TNS9_9GAMM|nr:hypothetical protein [Oceanisphaera arctica]PPL17250.1 hypothetical protein UN63_05625 [Oceanisphaera arctica]GHA20244.1 hypothetical protein GCM10007082_21210 [Oceanisphaera arctica]